MAKISIDLMSGVIEKKTAVIGIDLGTTNSLIATINQKDGSPYCITKDEQSIIPSAIYFGDNHIEVGLSAISQMVNDPENTVYSVKRLLGKTYSDLSDNNQLLNYKIIDEVDKLVKVEVRGKLLSAIELSSYILKELKLVAEKQLNSGINKVVITVPAYFNDMQRQATRDAGKLAGLDVLRIINEPTAASLAYGIGQKSDNPKIVAVYDLGGGTFDVSLLSIHNGVYEVLSTNGDTNLGGDDVDRAIVDHWKNEHNLKDINAQEAQLLRISAEKVKKELSLEKTSSVTIDIRQVKYCCSLTLKQLNAILEPLIVRTMTCCGMALKDAELVSDDIDEIVLVGGSTRSSSIAESVSRYFSKGHVNNTHNPDEVVALGAALEADILAGNRKDMLLLDVTPLSLGIETLGGLMDVLIPRNSKIPTRVRKEYSTSVDGQVNLKIGIYQGERDVATDNRKLGEFILENIPAMPAGLPKLEMTFALNADGILQVSAEEKRSGVKQDITITSQYAVSDEEIKAMLQESIDLAHSDMDIRSFTESKIEAEQLIYATDKFVKDNPELLTKEHIQNINLYKQELVTAINAKSRENIVSSMDKLNVYSKQFAEKAMDKNIAKALQGKIIE